MTKKNGYIFILLILAFCTTSFGAYAQYRQEHAYSIYGGYGYFKSDYGMRYDWETNLTNNAVNIGVKAYLNLYPYNMVIASHYRFYTNLDFIFAHLSHKGKWAEKDSPTGEKLRRGIRGP